MLLILIIIVLLVSVPTEANDIRNLAMGRLTLLAESEMNRLDMYDFGRNPAGLLRSVPASISPTGDEYSSPYDGETGTLSDYSYIDVALNGYGQVGSTGKIDKWAIGQPIPTALMEYMPLPWSVLGYDFHPYPSRPAGISWRSRTSDVATEMSGAWSHGEDVIPSSRLTINTPEFKYLRSGTFSGLDYGIEVSAFYFLAPGKYVDAQLLGPGLRLGIAKPNQSFEWGLHASYYHPFFHEKMKGWYSLDTSFNGNTTEGAGTLIFLPMDTLKLGLRAGYKWTKVDGFTFTSPWVGLRAAYSQPDGPMVGSLEAKWGNTHTSFSMMSFDDKTDSLGLSAGLGARTESWFSGIEAHYSLLGTKPFDSLASRTLTLQGGAEINLGTARVRGGGGCATTRWPNGGSSPARYWITGGCGVDLSEARLDLAYNFVRHSAHDLEHLLCLTVKFQRTEAGGAE